MKAHESGHAAHAAPRTHEASHAPSTMHHYHRLGAMLVVSFAAMYVLMYAMVDTFANALSNVNQIYMAGLMTAAMLVIELALMGSMYPRRSLNVALIVVGVVALAAFWFGIRFQVGVGDTQFLRSMVPHHAGAILMCEQAPIRDAEVRRLCDGILASQRAEIAQMRAMLDRRGTEVPATPP